MERIANKIANLSKLILLLAVILLIPSVFGYFNTNINYDILSYLPNNISTTKAEKILKDSKLILLLAVILLIPSVFGYFNTNINYDILSYLPNNISTTKAEKILKDDFGCGTLAVILLIPSVFGYFNTNINYDILSYLPNNISTTKAEKILKDDFGCGTLAMLIVENMDDKDVAKIKDKVAKVDGVADVLWVDDFMDLSVPKEILPKDMLIVENMDDKDVAKIKDKVAKVDGVADVLWVDDFMDLSVPKEILPKDMTDFLYNGDKSTMMIIKMEKATGDIKTQNAVSSIRNIAGKQSFLSGMCGILKDTKDLADKEVPLYILIGGLLILIILGLSLESTVIPIIFLTSIAMAVIYNFGSNIIFGEISYITKALAAVLQLGVTMDYSIFLFHRYEEEKLKFPDNKKDAMASAIRNTFISVIGGSVTTFAGFLALCVMDLAIGRDIGLVMAKGVLIGVICTITILPSFILVFDKQVEKYKHKTLIPNFNKVSKLVVKHNKKLAILFVIIFIPSYFGYKNADVYYNLDESLPANFPSIIATNKMKTDYNMESTNFILVKDTVAPNDLSKMIKEIDESLPANFPSIIATNKMKTDYNMESTNFILVKDTVAPNDLSKMIKEIENLDGITSVIGLEKYIGPRINQDFLPDDILNEVKSKGYEEILVNSKYKAATDECNAQIEEINKIVHEYDKEGLVGGEAPLTLDLIKIADSDFTKVNIASIVAIFIIITILFKSASLPVILVATIECAIFLNLGIPYYTGTVEPFIASIVLGTIQLGATIDYAILLTSRFREERNEGYEKFVPYYTGTVEPFIASIVLGTIQLGATIDYAILLTSRFREERNEGYEKFEAMERSIKSSAPSIITSALSFFGATIGVGLISKLDMISALCTLMSRGAIVSMFIIIFILPAILLLFEGIVVKTSKNFITKKELCEESN